MRNLFIQQKCEKVYTFIIWLISFFTKHFKKLFFSWLFLLVSIKKFYSFLKINIWVLSALSWFLAEFQIDSESHDFLMYVGSNISDRDAGEKKINWHLLEKVRVRGGTQRALNDMHRCSWTRLLLLDSTDVAQKILNWQFASASFHEHANIVSFKFCPRDNWGFVHYENWPN